MFGGEAIKYGNSKNRHAQPLVKKNFSASIVSPLLSMKNDIDQQIENVHSECDAMMAGVEDCKENSAS